MSHPALEFAAVVAVIGAVGEREVAQAGDVGEFVLLVDSGKRLDLVVDYEAVESELGGA